MEAHENYQKQTYRNRCTIGSEAGPLTLTVPVSEPACPSGQEHDRRITATLVSDHGSWRHLHWQALNTAYRDTPFFPYYADDLRPFFERRDWPTLWQLNEATRDAVCRLLDIHPHIVLTEHYCPPPAELQGGGLDLRYAISPKQAPHNTHKNRPDATEAQPQRILQSATWPQERPYWQPFLQRHGFLSNLSILDLLFCMGPEAKLFL